MTQGSLKIHSENILPIIKKWLYTDKEIFLRELVSNSCDAISKIKVLREQGKVSFNDEEIRIDIDLDKKAKTVKITDTGIGMTDKEVEKYIAQLAFSSAEEFVKKYQKKSAQEEIIGHFGLGFYSSFMVSDQVEINTCSYKENVKPAYWSCQGSCNYSLEEGTHKQRGTSVILHIASDSEDFLEESHVRTILMKHCRFLPYPIYLNGQHLNKTEPLWVLPASKCTDKDYLNFYKELYPFTPDPIFWIHLNIDYPFHLKGILYFPQFSHDFNLKESSIHLYCNRVFVSDNLKEIIPDYLSALLGVIDSSDLPLNVSRSDLQRDRTMKQLSSHISKKVSDKFVLQWQSDPKAFIEKWSDIEIIIKLGILQDDKFYDRVKKCLIWKNLNNEWTTIEEYLERNQTKKILYHHTDTKNSCVLNLYKDKEVLIFSSRLDIPIINSLEGKIEGISFQRIDGDIDDFALDKTREKTLLDETGKTEATHIANLFRTHLEGIDIQAKSLANDEVIAFSLFPEKERRARDYFTLFEKKLPNTWKKKPDLIVNTNNSLIQSMQKIKDPELVKILIKQVYELALLSQGELDSADFPSFLTRSNKLMEVLASFAIAKNQTTESTRSM